MAWFWGPRCGWATAGALTGWLTAEAWQNAAVVHPVYYDYGTNLYYEGDNVYYDGQVVATTEQYAQQAQEIAANIPDVQPDDVEWLPLGVFALTEKEGSVEDSTLFVQLAIRKEGIIAGSFQNTATDTAFEVEGTVDTKSQRAAWALVGESWPIMETGIQNLTENETGLLVHIEDGQTQQWTMVRLDEPDKDGANQSPVKISIHAFLFAVTAFMRLSHKYPLNRVTTNCKWRCPTNPRPAKLEHQPLRRRQST